MRGRLIAALALSVIVSGGAAVAATPDRAIIPAWISSTSFAPAKLKPGEPANYQAQSVRQDIVLNAATSAVRLRLTNEYGTEPVTVDRVELRLVNADGSLGTPVLAQFDKAPGIAIEPGTVRYTDAVAFAAPAFSRVAVTVHYPSTATAVAHRLMVRVGPGIDTPATATAPVRGAAIVSAIETEAPAVSCRHVIVALGDSITEGAGSTDNNDWPSLLAHRLTGKKCQDIVVNAGISGNKVLTNGGSPAMLARLDRDVFSQPGITDIVFVEGINDVRGFETAGGDADTAANALLGAYRQLVARAHARGIRVIGGTLAPYKGTARQNDLGLSIVDKVNAQIRAGGIFDAVVDFHKALGDPNDPQRMRADWHKGDWLHPNNAGYAVMASAIPVALFENAPSTR